MQAKERSKTDRSKTDRNAETFNINNFRFNKLSQIILQLHCGVFTLIISDAFVDPHEIDIMSGIYVLPG